MPRICYKNLIFAQFFQEQPLMNIAILVYEDVGLLDLAGPGEVFDGSKYFLTNDFNIYTVAESRDESVMSQDFLNIYPNYTFDASPVPDALIIPGAYPANLPLDEPGIIEWIKTAMPQARVTLAVCTGIGLLARAGLLDDKTVTTHHLYLDNLEKTVAEAGTETRIVRGFRFVEDGQLISTAGVSAGIDGALQAVTKLKKDASAAHKTADYMEYDWDPSKGLVVQR